MQRNAKFAVLDAIARAAKEQRDRAEREEQARWDAYCREHPVSAGLIRVEDYQPPRGQYVRAF